MVVVIIVILQLQHVLHILHKTWQTMCFSKWEQFNKGNSWIF